MSQPLISVILPIYNIEKYLRKCMDSLQRQTYQNLEILMVDDGATDSCPAICDEYASNDSRIHALHKQNGGLSDARNFGIAHASGEYITCIDPDDYVDDDYVEYLYSLIEKYETKMSVCQHRVHYDGGQIKDLGISSVAKEVVTEEAITNHECIKRMCYHDVIDTSAWAKLYRRDLFDSVQYPKGKIFEDIGTTYALMLQCDRIAVGYASKYNYMFHMNSIVNGSFSPKKFDLLEMTDQMGREVLAVYPDLRDAVRRRRVYARFSTLNQMLGTEEYIQDREKIIRFIMKNRRKIMQDPLAPRRDKAAILLLSINYRVYKSVWMTYQNRIMGK